MSYDTPLSYRDQHVIDNEVGAGEKGHLHEARLALGTGADLLKRKGGQEEGRVLEHV